MNIMKLLVAACACTVLVLGCGDKQPEEKAETVTADTRHTQDRATRDRPVRGIIRGQEFKIEQAILHDGTLTLRQGSDFFADRSIDIVIFGRPSLENTGIKVDMSTGLDSPHLRLGIMQEDEGLPDEIMIMDGYTMELIFGKATDLGIPFSIRLATSDLPRTDIEGSYFATYDDILIKDGNVDLSHDSFDTFRHLARQYLNMKHRQIELFDDFNASYKSHGDADYPKTGFIGYEAMIKGTPTIIKLQLYKDKNGWRVANQLAANQINQAHPVKYDAAMDKRSIQAGRARVVAARRLENYLNQEALMPAVRSTSVGCYTTKDLSRASCLAVYGLKNQDDVTCLNKNFLLVRNEDGWHVEKEIVGTQKVSYTTGELVPYKPFTMNCS